MKYSRLLVSSAVLVAVSSPVQADVYKVSIELNNQRLTHVEATLMPDDGVIRMNDEGNQGLKNGWSTFVEDLTVTDGSGNPLKLTYEQYSQWHLDNYKGGPITLSYKVRLKHDTVHINFGDNGAAYANSFGVMWAGRALFIAGKPTRDVTVHFDIPDKWHVTTPWEEKQGVEKSYAPRGTDDLINSAFFAGTHTTFDLTVGSASIRFALAGENVVGMRDRFSGLTGKYLRYYNETYGSARPAQMLFVAADASYWGGEVMGRVISLSVAEQGHGNFDPLTVLAHVISHEIYHLWNSGIEIADEDYSEFEWFFEGFTAEYSSWVAGLRLGDVDEETFLSQLSEDWNKYAAKRDGTLTLASAGKNKNSNYDLVYSGGMIAAATLDFQLRHETGNKKSLDQLLPHLLKRYPRTPRESGRSTAESLTLDKLLDAVRSLYGDKVAASLKRLATNPDVIPFPAAAELAGLNVKKSNDGKTLQLSLLSEPNKAQRAVWNAIRGE